MRTVFAAVCCLAIGCASAAPFAYVINESDQVKVIDLAANAVVATIPVGDNAIGVAVNPAGTRAYVTNYDSSTVSVIDTATNTVIATVNVCARPWVPAVSPLGNRVVVPCDSGSSVAVIDTTTHVVTALSAGAGPAVATYNPAGSRFFVTNIDSANVLMFDAVSLGFIAGLNVPLAPFATLVDPAGTRLYVASVSSGALGTNAIDVYALATGILVAVSPMNFAPTWMALNPSGTRLYVTKPDEDSVAVIDTSTFALVALVGTGTGTRPTSLGVHPDGTKLYVQLGGTGDLAVYDTSNLARIGTIDYGTGGVAYGNFIGPLSGASGAKSPGPLSGLWWNHNENGWGINFTQRGNVIFAAWYTYDASGNPKWYVASNCNMTTGTTCAGALYQVTGPRYFGVAFNPALNVVTQVGELQLNFTGANIGTMSYTVNGQGRTVVIERQVFQVGAVQPAINYTDLWWNPSESGWGIAVTQQFGVMFLAWYVYNDAGQPIWYVASNCTVAVAGNACTGKLYRTTGPAFGPTFDPALIQVFEVGSVALSFTDANNGVLSYTVDGVSGTKTITRQLF